MFVFTWLKYKGSEWYWLPAQMSKGNNQQRFWVQFVQNNTLSVTERPALKQTKLKTLWSPPLPGRLCMAVCCVLCVHCGPVQSNQLRSQRDSSVLARPAPVPHTHSHTLIWLSLWRPGGGASSGPLVSRRKSRRWAAFFFLLMNSSTTLHYIKKHSTVSLTLSWS